MAPPLADLTAQAQILTSAGDLAGARDVLADALDPADADPQRASPDLALAAALQARILIALGDPHAARTWAGFAHAAEERLHGPHDERTIAAAATHAAVLHRVGNHGRAAQLYHDLVAELTAVDGRLSARVLAAEADLATAEHASGQCTAARNRLADAWARHNQAHGEDAPAGIKMLARLAAMERECGHERDAQQHFSRAQELCARYLPPDHPLGRQVARLAGAQPSGRHTCGQVQRSTGPAADGPAPGVTRVPAKTPEVHPVRQEPPAPGDPTGRHARPEPPVPLPLISPAPPPEPTPPPQAALPVDTAPPSEVAPPPQADPPIDTAPPPEAVELPDTSPRAETTPWAETAPPPAAEAGPPRLEVTPPPQAHGFTPRRPDSAPLQDEAPAEAAPGAWVTPPPPIPVQAQQSWPETAPQPHMAMAAPAPPTHRPAEKPAERPVEQPIEQPVEQPVEQPRQGWAVEPPGPWPPDSFPPAAYPPDTYPPGPRLPLDEPPAPGTDRRLPVPVEKRNRQPLVLAAVLVAGIAAAAAIVIATWPREDAQPAAGPTASASAPVSAAPPAASASARPSNAAVAPTRVTLQDNRDSVALTWRYPKGSEGPVLISGGRTGQEQRAFQQLPAGTTDYVVYGLNRQNNYCFSVAVVYTVDQVAASEAVCTKR
ncbi:tetratricopeptide repeat protein [Actinoplanes sp. CA-051413]|uniref:tetratricopeptide repeat protein n=1 Tax=Actinoplanes sp. CA-051413 TaxID=3239899 RepID=UPI003D998E74